MGEARTMASEKPGTSGTDGTQRHLNANGDAVFHACVIDLMGDYQLQASATGASTATGGTIHIGKPGESEVVCRHDTDRAPVDQAADHTFGSHGAVMRIRPMQYFIQ